MKDARIVDNTCESRCLKSLTTLALVASSLHYVNNTKCIKGFGLNFCKRGKLNIILSLLTTFNVSNNFGVASSLPEIGLKPTHHNQAQLVQISDTHGICAISRSSHHSST